MRTDSGADGLDHSASQSNDPQVNPSGLLFLRPLVRDADHLPVEDIAGSVNAHLRAHNRLVVTAPPGAGKSTLLPLTILNDLPDGGKILMLEPRRLAARQVAERMSTMVGEQVGKTIGYRVRFESKVSEDTRIEVLTEGILTRMIVDDPTLEGVRMIIFDEFHERNLASDVAFALTQKTQQIIRPDLRILIMSATIDAQSICKMLDAPFVKCEGRMFPVETIHVTPEATSGISPVEACAMSVSHVIRQAHQSHEGDILAFLPGEAEIRRCAELLGTALGSTRIFPLYGMLPPKEQQQAIAPSKAGERKVVLATSIAETSLTIEGVRVVVDSGLCRKMVFDPQTGMSHLETVQISKDMADQRRGRAGRLAPGICYRLWTLATEHRMADCRVPEMEEADLAPMLLDIAAWGGCNVKELQWITPPPSAHLEQGMRLLRQLNALDEERHITSHGKALAKLPCHPRIAQMLVLARGNSQKALAADMAALLEEKDPLATEIVGAELRLRLDALNEAREGRRRGKVWERIIRAAEQYRRLAQHASTQGNDSLQGESLLLAAAYPERIAHAIPDGIGCFQLASGDIAKVDANDDLCAYDWIAIASLHTQQGGIGNIFLASPLNRTDLKPFVREKENVSWDNRRGQVVAQREYRIGSLLVESKPMTIDSKASPEAADNLQKTITKVICEAARKEGTSMLDFNDAVQNLQRRVATVAGWHPELNLPDLSTDAVLQRCEKWLPFFLEGTNDLKRIDLTQALWTLLSYEQQQEVERIAPTHITVPTGSRIRVEYRQGAELPILRVRLQECFGLTDTPRIDDGKRPILMELLSPGFKPVQLTSDLRSFWTNTYFEVRKELRRRYPKHSWPDNPLEAEAVRGVKRNRE